jgi:hypothetical protein
VQRNKFSESSQTAILPSMQKEDHRARGINKKSAMRPRVLGAFHTSRMPKQQMIADGLKLAPA